MVRPFGSIARTWKALAAVVAMALVAVVLIATPGSATFAKKYDLVMTTVNPAPPIPVGTSSATIKATFTNKSLYSIGSVTLTVPTPAPVATPAKYTIMGFTQPTSGVVTLASGGQSLSITGLNLVLNKPYSITMTVSVACDAATGSWGSTAKLFGGTTPFTLNNPTGGFQKTTVTGTCTSPPGDVTVAVSPSVNTGTSSVRFVPGKTNVTFQASSSGNPPPAITWQYSLNGNFPSPTDPAPIFTGSSFSLSPAQASDSGFYRAVASNGLGTPSTSTPIQLEPSDLTLAFVQPPTNALRNVPFAPEVQVQFYADGEPSNAFNGETVTITNSGSGTGSFLPLGANTAPLTGNGVASFPGLAIDTFGAYTLTASVDVDGGPSTDPVSIFIGAEVIQCGQTKIVTNADDPSLTASVTQTSDTGCSTKPYVFTHNGDSVQFLYPTGGTPSSFTIEVTSFAPEPVPSGSVPMTLIDTIASGPLATPRAIKWCNTNANGPVLPAGEVTCLVSQSTVTLATNQIQVTETYYLEGDILYKR